MPQPKVDIRHVSKVFHQNVRDALREPHAITKPLSQDDKIALNDINLTFSSGETIGIIGRNGAGKSTLLSIIAGLAKQTEGELVISGKVTAVMTLGVGLREDLTGRDNIYLDGELQGKSRDEIDLFLDEIITFAELDDFIDRPVKTYSTGMKSRLAFSMLVGIEPEILIIDEALSAGDVFFAEKATKKIKEICDKGKIVLLVSHGMAVIESMCNRCLWLEKGKVIMDGEPAEVTKQYLKQVQEEDQKKEFSTYQLPVSHTLPQARYKVHDVWLRSGEKDQNKQTIFYTNEPLSIAVEMIQECSNQGRLQLIIERLDGLIVSFEQYDLDEEDSLDKELLINLEFSLDLLVLNRGFYQLKLDVIERDESTNQFTRFFEVKNKFVAKGGVSLLHYPAEIQLINEEVTICSDLKELMDE